MYIYMLICVYSTCLLYAQSVASTNKHVSFQNFEFVQYVHDESCTVIILLRATPWNGNLK